MNKTFFCDIDGTLLKHHGHSCLHKAMMSPPEILPNVIETLDNWKYNEHCIILTTGRPESMRRITEEQLEKVGIFYDMLIMGLPHGERIVVNDNKPTLSETAIGITVERNKGFTENTFSRIKNE
jgi:hypothetical protein